MLTTGFEEHVPHNLPEIVLAFPGKYDPPTIGHVAMIGAACDAVRDTHSIVAIVVSPPADRVEMCRRAFEPLNGALVPGVHVFVDPSWDGTQWEKWQTQMCQYVLSIRKRLDDHPECAIGVGFGSDVVEHNTLDDLRSVCKVIVVPRRERDEYALSIERVTVARVPSVEASSSEVRRLLRTNRRGTAAAYLPGTVFDYITKNGMYAN